ncbi:hypothetical protein [Pseudanabaena sp. FACHB-2040]|uniref:hypothetical protein n=1 Tax=Pseudanabaena sp. FACHB-2040 TaxID=2692859 RepID=UPI0016857E69|nr:hypothetical protein [Pseudanabaena sp. FACHB-2040]MBD2256662.1 hypothetical protein [Pseudanabaena sp. FACHB-2040]
MTPLHNSIQLAASDIPIQATITSTVIDLKDCNVVFQVYNSAKQQVANYSVESNNLTLKTNTNSRLVIVGAIPGSITRGWKGVYDYRWVLYPTGGGTIYTRAYEGSFTVQQSKLPPL